VDDFDNVRKAVDETRRRITRLQSPGFTENKTLEALAIAILLIGAFIMAYFLLIFASDFVSP
jgi:hypothetical protein